MPSIELSSKSAAGKRMTTPARSPAPRCPAEITYGSAVPPLLTHSFRDAPCRRLVAAGNGAECDVNAVCAVDRHYRDGQVDQLLLAKVLARLLIDRVRNLAVLEPGERLGPGKRSAFARALEGAFAPST